MIKLYEPWETEIEELSKYCREGYANVDDILYLIHPSTASDCDRKGAAIHGCIDELEKFVNINAEAVLIYPPQGKIYIDPSKVTKIRGGKDGSDWIYSGDLKDRKLITFVGGKIELCLGSAYNHATLLKEEHRRFDEIFDRNTGDYNLSVRLPFNAIYTKRGNTAQQEFAAGKSVLDEVESLLSILSSDNYDEYSIIYPRQTSRITNLYLNGRNIARFDGSIQTDNLPILLDDEEYPIEVDLYVETTDNNFVNDSIAEIVKYNWDQIKHEFEPYLK